MYIPPESNVVNPNYNFRNITVTSNNATYFPTSDYFCGGIINNTGYRSLFTYLVTYATGSSTTVNIQSNFAGGNNGDLLQVLYGVSPSYFTVVQQVLIGSQQLTIPLIVSGLYSLRIISPNCGATVYSTGFSTQPNPININIPTNFNYNALQTPKVNATCFEFYNASVSNEMVRCQGNDTLNLVNRWQISIYKAAGFTTIGNIAGTNISGSSFIWQYYPVPNSLVTAKIIAFYGGVNNPSTTFLYVSILLAAVDIVHHLTS